MIYIACPIYCHKVFYIIMEALEKELVSMNYSVAVEMLHDNKCYIENHIIILFGPQHLQNLSETIQKNNVIVFNLEQLISTNWDSLLHQLNNVVCIWDYSSLNLEYTKQRFPSIRQLHVLVPFGYSNSFQNPNISSLPKSLIRDRIAFIGNMSKRRYEIIERLQKIVPVDVYDHHYYHLYEEVVDRYETFLNLHFHEDPNILEIVRILPLLVNNRKVISERSNDHEIDETVAPVVHYIDSHNLEDLRCHILSFPVPSQQTLELIDPWYLSLHKGMSNLSFQHFSNGVPKIAISTLHCNNRKAIFEVIESFAKETSTRTFIWIIYSQGCDDDHNELIRKSLRSNDIPFELICNPKNLGWSKGMNKLYELLVEKNFEYILHLEDDWICHHETHNQRWLDDCCIYLHNHSNVSTLFLRKYMSEEDKWMYGWTRNIFYNCFIHPDPFNYQDKIKDQPKIDFRSLTLRKIPDFLYSANPTLFRLKDYIEKGIFPFPEFHDASQKQGEWKTTTMEDAPQWGFSEAISMEKIRELTCVNVNHGFFYHRN